MTMPEMRRLVSAIGRVPLIKLADLYFTGIVAERCTCSVPRQEVDGSYKLFDSFVDPE